MRPDDDPISRSSNVGVAPQEARDQGEVSQMVRAFFEDAYGKQARYWIESDPYSLSSDAHGPYHATILRLARQARPRSVLDVGCGEGSDVIRLARLGLAADALDISGTALEKAERFAKDSGAGRIVWREADVANWKVGARYDLVMCNGVAHYIVDKPSFIRGLMDLVSPGGCLAISEFSTTTAIPSCHRVIPVFPDIEGGLVESALSEWEMLFRRYERGKTDLSHQDFPLHRHSHIKVIARRPVEAKCGEDRNGPGGP